MAVIVMFPVYLALWLLAVHVHFLMRHEKKQDQMWIYPVFTLIGLSFFSLIGFLLH